jgi:hypothetical protein
MMIIRSLVARIDGMADWPGERKPRRAICGVVLVIPTRSASISLLATKFHGIKDEQRDCPDDESNGTGIGINAGELGISIQKR